MHLNILATGLTMTSILAAAMPIPVPPHGPGGRHHPNRVPTLKEAAREARTMVKFERFAKVSVKDEKPSREKYAECHEDSSLTFLFNKGEESLVFETESPALVTIKKHPFTHHKPKKHRKDSKKPERPRHGPVGFDDKLSLNGKFVQVDDSAEISLHALTPNSGTLRYTMIRFSSSSKSKRCILIMDINDSSLMRIFLSRFTRKLNLLSFTVHQAVALIRLRIVIRGRTIGEANIRDRLVQTLIRRFKKIASLILMPLMMISIKLLSIDLLGKIMQILMVMITSTVKTTNLTKTTQPVQNKLFFKTA